MKEITFDVEFDVSVACGGFVVIWSANYLNHISFHQNDFDEHLPNVSSWIVRGMDYFHTSISA